MAKTNVSQSCFSLLLLVLLFVVFSFRRLTLMLIPSTNQLQQGWRMTAVMPCGAKLYELIESMNHKRVMAVFVALLILHFLDIQTKAKWWNEFLHWM